VCESEVTDDPGDADHEDQDEHPEEALSDALSLIQLVEAPQKLGFFFRSEGTAEQELLNHFGEPLRVAAVLAVPLRERLVGAKGVDFDALFVFIHSSLANWDRRQIRATGNERLAYEWREVDGEGPGASEWRLP
jgi:hypothetical protein